MNKINVRYASRNDADAITQLNAAMGLETESVIINSETLRKGVDAILSDPNKGLYFVAEIDDKVVGQLMITYEWSDWRNAFFWWIQSVYVLPQHRNAGVFKTLYNFVHDIAKKDQMVCGLRLYVDTHNITAKEAYKHLGMSASHYEMYELDLTK